MAIAIARPSSPSALAALSQEALNGLQQDESQQQDVTAVRTKFPVWLHQQAYEVRSSLTSVLWLMQLHRARTMDNVCMLLACLQQAFGWSLAEAAVDHA